ncbi:MAG: OmpA family protein, partial [Desulfobacterales bacterium]|nr:OmpA family protein [Desulfobacterales bacterium]
TQVFPSNWELSTARAVNVLRYFIETHKIDPQRLAAVGFGEYQPLTSNNAQPNQSKNRRVEIIFIKQDPQQTSIEGAS